MRNAGNVQPYSVELYPNGKVHIPEPGKSSVGAAVGAGFGINKMKSSTMRNRCCQSKDIYFITCLYHSRDGYKTAI